MLNAIAKVKERKNAKSSEENSTGANEDLDCLIDSENATHTEGDDVPLNANRLNLFLQASSQLCEDLLQDQQNAMLAKSMETRGE